MLSVGGEDGENDLDLDSLEARHAKAAIILSQANDAGFLDDDGSAARDFVIIDVEGHITDVKKGTSYDDIFRILEKFTAEDIGKLSVHTDRRSAIDHHAEICFVTNEHSRPDERRDAWELLQEKSNPHVDTIQDFVTSNMGSLFHGLELTSTIATDVTITVPRIKPITLVWNMTREEVTRKLIDLSDENPDARWDLMDIVR